MHHTESPLYPSYGWQMARYSHDIPTFGAYRHPSNHNKSYYIIWIIQIVFFESIKLDDLIFDAQSPLTPVKTPFCCRRGQLCGAKCGSGCCWDLAEGAPDAQQLAVIHGQQRCMCVFPIISMYIYIYHMYIINIYSL